MANLRDGPLSGLALIPGGRSAGARVACRTAATTGAHAVLCLAFPLRPPQRKGAKPRPSRLDELEAAPVPMLIVQGERDQFGMPPHSERWTLVKVAGNHSLRSGLDAVRTAVERWLPEVAPG